MTLAVREPPIPYSPLTRWDPRWKLAGLLMTSAAFAVITHPLLTAIAFALGLIGVRVGRLNRRDVCGRLLMISFGMLPVLLVFPFTNDNGLTLAISMTLRALAIACVGSILLRTAPLTQTLAAAHCLYLPGVLVQIALLAYRYAFLFFAEARRVRIALRTRAFRAATNLRTYQTTGQAIGSLLVRGGDRAEQVADAMRTRGFDGRFHTIQHFRTTAGDVAGLVVVVLGIVALLVGEWWL